MKFKILLCIISVTTLSACTVNHISSNAAGTIESEPYLSRPLKMHGKILVISTTSNNQITVMNGFVFTTILYRTCTSIKML
jgi:hypothetical protein